MNCFETLDFRGLLTTCLIPAAFTFIPAPAGLSLSAVL
jgi:hypothetical protein